MTQDEIMAAGGPIVMPGYEGPGATAVPSPQEYVAGQGGDPGPYSGNTRPTLAENGPSTELGTLDMPTLSIPEFELPEEAGVGFQLNKNLSKDSLTSQRARTTGLEQAAREGRDNSSMSAGYAMNSLIDKNTPIAIADASTAAQGALQGWKSKVDANVGVYNKQYQERLNGLGFDQRTVEAMIQANTSLSQSLFSAANSLLGNTDLDNSEGLVDWITENIMQPAQESNNAFVGNIYTF